MLIAKYVFVNRRNVENLKEAYRDPIHVGRCDGLHSWDSLFESSYKIFMMQAETRKVRNLENRP